MELSSFQGRSVTGVSILFSAASGNKIIPSPILQKCYGMDWFDKYFTHVQTCNVTRVQSATEWTAPVHSLHMSQTCNVTRVQSATEWTASVILYTVQTYDVTRVQSATEWTAAILHTCPKLHVQVLRNVYCGAHFTTAQTCNEKKFTILHCFP